MAKDNQEDNKHIEQDKLVFKEFYNLVKKIDQLKKDNNQDKLIIEKNISDLKEQIFKQRSILLGINFKNISETQIIEILNLAINHDLQGLTDDILHKIRYLKIDLANKDVRNPLTCALEKFLVKKNDNGLRVAQQILDIDVFRHIINPRAEYETSPFLMAVRIGNKDILKAMFDYNSDKPDINYSTNVVRNNSLIIAIAEGHVDILQMLLEKKVNVNHKNREDITPIMFALKMMVQNDEKKEYEKQSSLSYQEKKFW